MKLVVVLTVCIFLSGSNAGFLDSLKQTFASLGQSLTTAFQPVLESGKTLGTQLLAHAAQTGSTLAGQALSALAQTLLAATQGQPATNPAPAVGAKRDFVLLDHHRGGGQLQAQELLTVDQFRDVTEFLLRQPQTQMQPKRGMELLQNLDLAKSQLDQALSDKFGNLNKLFHAGVDSIHGVLEHAAQQASTLDLKPTEVVHQIESIVAMHNGLVDHAYGDVIKTIVQHLEKFALQHGGNKRSVSDVLSGLGSALTQFFQPHLDALKQTLTGLGGAVATTVNQLQEPGNDLVNHAHALVDALQQTFVNALPHVLGALNAGGQLLSAAASNLANTLGQQPATSP